MSCAVASDMASDCVAEIKTSSCSKSVFNASCCLRVKLYFEIVSSLVLVVIVIYQLQLDANGSVQFEFNGEKIIDRWSDPVSEPEIVCVTMEKGKKYSIKIQLTHP